MQKKKVIKKDKKTKPKSKKAKTLSKKRLSHISEVVKHNLEFTCKKLALSENDADLQQRIFLFILETQIVWSLAALEFDVGRSERNRILKDAVDFVDANASRC
jgi:hypothetical protein